MPENRRVVFLNQVLDALKQRLPDASDADLLKAATRQIELEEASKAASAERRVSKAQQQAAEAKEVRKLELEEQAVADAKAEKIRAENPEGLIEYLIGAPGSKKRDLLRNVGITGGLGTVLGTGGTVLLNTAGKMLEGATSDTPPPATAPGGKAPLTLSAQQESDYLNSIQVFNERLRGQALRLRMRGNFEGAQKLYDQQLDPSEALENYRLETRRQFEAATQRKKDERLQELQGEQELERIKQETERLKQEAENQRKVLDLAGQVIKSTEGSMNIDLLPSRR